MKYRVVEVDLRPTGGHKRVIATFDLKESSLAFHEARACRDSKLRRAGDPEVRAVEVVKEE